MRETYHPKTFTESAMSLFRNLKNLKSFFFHICRNAQVNFFFQATNEHRMLKMTEGYCKR